MRHVCPGVGICILIYAKAPKDGDRLRGNIILRESETQEEEEVSGTVDVRSIRGEFTAVRKRPAEK